jgi:hypothetical protein
MVLADVFATLCTYAGVPAFWAKVEPSPEKGGIILSFASIRGRWVVFDVANGVVFRNDRGDLAALDDLRGRPDLVPARLRDVSVGERAYATVITTVEFPEVPHPLRAELQMPWRRLRYELGCAIGVGECDGSER